MRERDEVRDDRPGDAVPGRLPGAARATAQGRCAGERSAVWHWVRAQWGWARTRLRRAGQRADDQQRAAQDEDEAHRRRRPAIRPDTVAAGRAARAAVGR